MIQSSFHGSVIRGAMVALALIVLVGRFAAGDALANGLVSLDAPPHAASEAASRRLRLPIGFTMARVVDDGHFAGQRMQVWQLRAPFETRMALHRVLSGWREAAGARVIEHRHAGWLIVSRLSEGALEVLQLREDARLAEGFLTLWHAGQSIGHSSLAELLPNGFRSGPPLRILEGNRQVLSASAEVDAPIDAARHRLDRHLRALDFKPAVLAEGLGDASIVRYIGRDRDLTVLARGSGQRSHFAFTLSEIQP
jgi:hypothetical protein